MMEPEHGPANRMSDPQRIKSVYLMPNGLVAVFDGQGEQMPAYQGRLEKVREAIERDAGPETQWWGDWPSKNGQEVRSFHAVPEAVIKAARVSPIVHTWVLAYLLGRVDLIACLSGCVASLVDRMEQALKMIQGQTIDLKIGGKQ